MYQTGSVLVFLALQVGDILVGPGVHLRPQGSSLGPAGQLVGNLGGSDAKCRMPKKCRKMIKMSTFSIIFTYLHIMSNPLHTQVTSPDAGFCLEFCAEAALNWYVWSAPSELTSTKIVKPFVSNANFPLLLRVQLVVVPPKC